MAEKLAGDALLDAGREAGYPSLDGKPWSELNAEDKRTALARDAEERASAEVIAPQPPRAVEGETKTIYLDVCVLCRSIALTDVEGGSRRYCWGTPGQPHRVQAVDVVPAEVTEYDFSRVLIGVVANA